VLATKPAKVTAVVFDPLQILWFATLLTVGVGFTVKEKSIELPGQLFAEGVAFIIAIAGDEPVLVPINEEIFPIPLEPKPIEGIVFVQLIVVPDTLLEKLIAFKVEPLQTT
jgi:hypothetical protein